MIPKLKSLLPVEVINSMNEGWIDNIKQWARENGFLDIPLNEWMDLLKVFEEGERKMKIAYNDVKQTPTPEILQNVKRLDKVLNRAYSSGDEIAKALKMIQMCKKELGNEWEKYLPYSSISSNKILRIIEMAVLETRGKINRRIRKKQTNINVKTKGQY